MVKEEKSGMVKKGVIAFVVVIALILGFTFYTYYFKYFGPNVSDKRQYLYVRTGSGFEDVLKTVTDSGIVKDVASFVQAAENMNYTAKVKPGRYLLKDGMSNRRLINLLKAGNQEPVKLSIHNKRLKTDLAKFVSARIEADSASVMNLLNSSLVAEKYGFTTDNIYTMFIPNSYEIYWNTSAEQFLERMHQEYEKFWNTERTSKAAAIGFSKIQVAVMASIVDSEATYDDEMPIIAGLYMNRYRQGITLDADPTLIFAANDFTIRRVLNKHKRIVSPYNTYMYAGLPPGPIMMPSVKAIDAVLNFQKNKYIYMCAKEDFSGRHNFAEDITQHEINANKFRNALDERNIKR